jgi:hypothetical protein
MTELAPWPMTWLSRWSPMIMSWMIERSWSSPMVISASSSWSRKSPNFKSFFEDFFGFGVLSSSDSSIIEFYFLSSF